MPRDHAAAVRARGSRGAAPRPDAASVGTGCTDAAAMHRRRRGRAVGATRVSDRAKSAAADEPVVAGVRISHPGRVVYPDDRVTKLALPATPPPPRSSADGTPSTVLFRTDSAVRMWHLWSGQSAR